MTCINKNNKNFKLAKARYGTSFAELAIRNISKSKGLIDDFYYPTIQEIKDYYKEEIKKKETLIFDALKNSTSLTLKTITDLLQGVIHKHNGIYFVTQGFGNNQSSIIRADNYTMIYRPNLEIIKKLEEMYPDIFSRTYVVKYTPPGASSNLSFVVENLNLKGREKIFDDYDLEVFKTPSKERNTILKIARIYRDVPLSIKRPFITRLTINPKLILTPVKEEVESEESLLNENLRTLGYRDRDLEVIQKEGQFISVTGNIYSSLQEALIDKDGQFEELFDPNNIKNIQPKVLKSTQLNLFDDTLFRLNNKIFEKSIPELDNILFEYLKPFNIKYEDIEIIKNKYNVNPLGAVDIIQKVMYLAKERDIYTVPEEFSHLIVMLMGENNPIISSLLENIESWSEYLKIKNKYFNKYKGNIKKIKVEAIGQLLSKAIVNKWKSQNKLEQNWFNTLKQLIFNFINKFKKENILIHELANRIAVNVLTYNNITTVSSFKTFNTGLRDLGVAHRGSGNYYALDRPFSTGKISEEIRIVQLQYNTKRVLDLTKYQETNISDENSIKYEKILNEAKIKYDKLNPNQRKLNTYNDLIQETAIENNIDGIISYIEPGAPDIETMKKIGREFVEYKALEQLIEIPNIKNKIPINYSKELSDNKIVNYVINIFKDIKGINLTGSLAISKFQNIWRDPQNSIHDLDFQIDYNYTIKNKLEDFFELLNKPNIEIAHNGWKANKEITFSFYIIPEKYSFDKSKTIRDANGRVKTPYLDLTVLDEKGNKIKSLELLEKIELIGVDFFWPLFPKKSIFMDNTLVSRDVYNGKLQLGNQLDTPEVFFQRIKDQNDYILSNYTKLIDPISDNLYFRLNDDNEIIENAKTVLFDKTFKNKLEKLQNGEKVLFTIEESDYLYNLLSDTIKSDLKENNINNFNEFINNQTPSSLLTRIINYIKSLLFQQRSINIIDKIKSTNIDDFFTEKGNLIIYGLTENQKTRLSVINKLLYRAITPFSYNKLVVIGQIPFNLFLGKSYELTNLFIKKLIKINEKYKKYEITEEQYNKRIDAWRLSNGLPQKHNTFKYIGRGFFDINFNFIQDENGEDFYNFVNPVFKVEDLKAKKSIDDSNLVMGNYDLKTGQDEYGYFLQYNDRWDLDLKNKLINFVVDKTQKPFNITGKIYNAISFDNEGNEFIYFTYDKNDPSVKYYKNFIEYFENTMPIEGNMYQISEEGKIKPGVEELLDSNPELANEVYEAAGFNNLIKPTDRIIWGHPTIGKTTTKQEKDFLDFDTDFKPLVAKKLGLPESQQNSLGLNEWRKTNSEEDFNKAMREVWNIAKTQAKNQNKILMVSDMIFLRENQSDFDKIINVPSTTFINRAAQRGDNKENLQSWKNKIDQTLKNVDSKKIITTDKYLSDLFITPQQKQQALQLYSQYLDSIFPDSQVKDIVYHASRLGVDRFEKFVSKNNEFYFSDNEEYNRIYTSGILYNLESSTQEDIDETKEYIQSYSVLLNIKNPKILDLITYESVANNKNTENDALIGFESLFGKPSTIKDYVVFKPEQIHILGNKQDIEGFKEFVGKSTTLIDTIDPIQNIVNKINSNFTEEDLNNQLNNCKI